MNDIAVVTIVSGRHRHLRNQLRGLAEGTRTPDLHVVVAVDDSAVHPVARGFPRTCVVEIEAGARLPLARARNVGASAALAAGADGLIFLDVDCVPSRTLVDRYRSVLEMSSHHDALLCGQVNYVPAAGEGGTDLAELARMSRPHDARPQPADTDVIPTTAYHLFWSLSFAVSAAGWDAVGGFCESYLGYGGEDTDFAQTAAANGLAMAWVGGAVAYHQYHRVSAPPTEHLDEILANAATFHRRWGWWPMQGWLAAFADAGLAHYDAAAQSWTRART